MSLITLKLGFWLEVRVRQKEVVKGNCVRGEEKGWASTLHLNPRVKLEVSVSLSSLFPSFSGESDTYVHTYIQGQTLATMAWDECGVRIWR
jgi:hypothetical protein